MDNNFDDNEIDILEAMTAQNRNNKQNVVNNINNVNSVKSTIQRDSIKTVKSTGQKNNNKPVRLTGHIDKSKKSKLSGQIKARAVAGAALAGIVLFNIVGRANTNPHELTAGELATISSNSENFNKLNLSNEDLQSLIDLSNKYQTFYDKVQDKKFVLSDDDIHELQSYLDTYKTLSKSIIADKVSSVTDVDAKDIIVVDRTEEFPFITVAVRGKDNGGSLLVVGTRFNTEPLPITFRNVAQKFVDLHNASVEFRVENFGKYAKTLNSALGNLNTFAGSELMYDGKNFKEIYFDKNNIGKSYTDNSDQAHSSEFIHTSYENDDMDR